jgi:hypothetical protein
MSSNSEAPGTQRKHPILVMTVFAAVVARNRELSTQLASLSAGKVLIQKAMSDQANRIQELEHDNYMLKNEKKEQELTNLDEKLREVREEQLEKDELLKYNATLLRRALLAENELRTAKNLHKTAELALEMAIQNARPMDSGSSALNTPQKRAREPEEYVEHHSKAFEKHG